MNFHKRVHSLYVLEALNVLGSGPTTFEICYVGSLQPISGPQQVVVAADRFCCSSADELISYTRLFGSAQADLRGGKGACPPQNLAPDKFQKRPFGVSGMQENHLAARALPLSPQRSPRPRS